MYTVRHSENFKETLNKAKYNGLLNVKMFNTNNSILPIYQILTLKMYFSNLPIKRCIFLYFVIFYCCLLQDDEALKAV